MNKEGRNRDGRVKSEKRKTETVGTHEEEHENPNSHTDTHFTHARRLLCFHAPCYSSVLQDCTCRKTLYTMRGVSVVRVRL